jgi:phosphate ABC transporter permease protein PstC
VKALPTLGEVELRSLLGSAGIRSKEYYGILPLITGSVIITFGAALIAVPFGIGTAIYISEIAPAGCVRSSSPWWNCLAGFPLSCWAFLGSLSFRPSARLLDLPTGLTALAGSLLLGGIAVPTVVSVAEDALDAVPRAYREGAWALGATRWQTIWRVTLPAARSGVLTAVMLGVGRAIGETMTVMMVTGNAPVLAIKLSSLFSPVRTMTATIAAEMGEVANGSTHYHVLFFIGMVLFIISLGVNIAASSVVFRAKKRAERILSSMKYILTRNRHITQRIGFTAITLMALATVIPIVAVVVYILIQGAPAISLEFLTGFPYNGMRAGGILPAIIGTIYLTIGTAIFSVPLGIAAAVYLSEYASDTPLTRVRSASRSSTSPVFPRSCMDCSGWVYLFSF